MSRKKSNSDKSNEGLSPDQNVDNPAERFNLMILKSERLKMVKLQKKCFRKHRVCNLSEILRLGIAAMEKLSDSEIEIIIEELEEL